MLHSYGIPDNNKLFHSHLLPISLCERRCYLRINGYLDYKTKIKYRLILYFWMNSSSNF